MSKVISLSAALDLADELSDAGQQDAVSAIRSAAGLANLYQAKLQKLAWACREKSARKREEALQRVLMELDAAGESTSALPSLHYV